MTFFYPLVSKIIRLWYRKVVLTFFILSYLQLTTVSGQIYYAGGADGLWEITIQNGSCSANFIGPFTDIATGNDIFAGDIAICPNGELYITDNSSLWEVDPSTGEVSLAVFSPSYLGIVALGCAGGGILYGAAFNLGGGPILYRIDVNAGTITSVGVLPFNPGGDLHLYGGTWYMSASEGLVQLDVSNPGSSTLLFSGVSFVGMTAFADDCNTLLGGDGNNLFTIDLDDETVSSLCSVPGVQIGGLTTQAEFDPISACEISLDLDEDDSSGATEADYDSEPYTCLTESGLAVADEDLDLETAGTSIDFMTINLVGGNANGPDEYLELQAANNITINGSGTSQLTLTNAGGATVTNFRNAVLAIRYFNDGQPLIGGDRTIEVQFTLENAAESNIGVATIPVEIYPEILVDLGNDITICQGEGAILDAGILNAEYLWTTNETTKEITVGNPGQYAVTVSAEFSCPGSDTVEVIVLPNYELTLIGDTICLGEEAVISFITDAMEPLDLVIESTPGGQTLTWTGVNSGYSEGVLFNESQTLEITSYSLTSGGEACWVNLQLTAQVGVNLLDTTYQEVNLCEGDIYEVGGGFQTVNGVYEDIYLNSEGCDSLVITDLTFWPLDTTILQSTSCDPNLVGQVDMLYINDKGCDSLVIIITSFSATDTTQISASTCDPLGAGITTDLFTNQQGCDSLVITTTIYQASDTTLLQETSCDPGQAGTTTDLFANQQGCDSLVITTTIYQASDTTLLQGTTCDPGQAGTTTNLFTNQQGCDSLVITTTIYQASDTTLLQETSCDPGQAGTTTDLFTNQQGCDSLVITTTIYQASDTTLLQETSCDPGQAGTTTDLFTNQQGCDSLVITTTTYHQASDTTLLQGTSCDPGQAGTTTNLFTNQQGCDSLVITTITLFPSTRDTLIALTCQIQDTSTTVINLTNQAGCDSIIVWIVEWTGSDSCNLEIGVEVTQPRCIGDSGEIRLDVAEGTFPIEASWGPLNGSSQTITLSNADPLTILSGLSPGIYILFAIDANGQTWQDTVTILSGQQFSIDLGDDLQVPFGTLVNLNLQVNPQTTVLQSILWEPDLCTFCKDPSILVEEEITVRVTVESDSGCVGNDQIKIRVDETTTPRVYIPNVFSPNNDGINDQFTLYGNEEVSGIRNLTIFDRWGNELYRREALLVNDPAEGWDGTFRGKLMDAAVFVYVAEVVLKNGSIRLYKGEVMLVR